MNFFPQVHGKHASPVMSLEFTPIGRFPDDFNPFFKTRTSNIKLAANKYIN